MKKNEKFMKLIHIAVHGEIKKKDKFSNFQILKVKVWSGAFTDGQGNAYAGLTSGYTISTKPLIEWSLVADDNFDGTGVGYNYFGGERYGAAVAISATNEMIVLHET